MYSSQDVDNHRLSFSILIQDLVSNFLLMTDISKVTICSWYSFLYCTMTSSNGKKYFRVTGPLSPLNSPHKGQWRGALMFSLICAWINGWVNNREAGDLRRHGAHYDVIVMSEAVTFRFTRRFWKPFGKLYLSSSALQVWSEYTG